MREKWLDLRLGDILKVKSGHDQKTIECENGKYQILGTGGEIGRTNTFLYDKPSVLIGRKGTINKPMYKNEPFWTVDTLFYTEIKDNFSPKYVYYLFNTINWLRYNEASGVPSLTSSTIEKIKVKVPDLETQQKIVQVLDLWNKSITELDRTITLERMKNESLSQKIAKIAFAKESIKKPMKNYLKERKQYQKKAGGLPHVSLTKEGVVPKSERYNRDFLVKNDDEKQYKVTKKGDICYNPANLKFGVICRNHLGDGIFSPIYVTFEIQNANPDYLEALLISSEFVGRSLRYEQGTVYERKAVNPEDLLRMEVFLPSVEEQKRIAKIIINQKEYIDKLKKLKMLLAQQYKYLLNHLISGDYDLTNIKLENGKEQQ